MTFNLIYDLLLLSFALLAMPKLLYQWIFHKKYRQSIPQRLGLGFPEINKGDKKLIWVHAVSMGETKAVSTIVRRIKNDYPDAMIVTSSVTETGLAEAKRSMPEADHHVFLPLDFMWIVKPIIKMVNPDIVILCETDFWFNFLKRCKKQGAHIYLVNGKLSKRSLERYKKFSWFADRLFSFIDKYCVQSNHYKERFLELGIDEQKIVVTGNIKFDGNYPKLDPDELQEWKEKLGIPQEDRVLVAGYTHHPEEKIVLNALSQVWKDIPDISLVLVPRHPERFEEVVNFLQKQGVPFNRFSQLDKKKNNSKVVVIDAMGLLRQCYQLADVALVAGSYTSKVGGHNIIEPSWYGVPVIYGPHMHSQPELVELVEKYQAGLQIEAEDLPKTLLSLFGNTPEREQLGKAGKKMANELQGAAEKTYQAIINEDSK